jgi:acyl-CoA thioester hydrolase
MSDFTVSVRPRYGEVDSMGVVYHAHYLVYFELGRTELMRSLGASYAGLEQRGFRLAVVDAAVQYRQPALYDEELTVHVRISELRRASVRFDYELRDGPGRLLASGHTRLGCLNTDQRPTRLPDDAFSCLQRGMPGGGRTSEEP